ncbi:hypothetical protein M407DRAFT_26769 [Tulasnella calospora MUT 4182]|uniref:DUF6535 domain-containing protein n=1 Tax=Tulasnella calospora MUT 4182 TaxID=1051891 RepID=A0A0C3Q4I3_9AGAM|nr:hypothetical protein M407DRAFT_26769 [Tulasnella calospora MUT 4182]
MFYQRYDALAGEIDQDKVKGLKEHLDGLLVFAGRFAGVNSAFLALTLPLLSADPVDDPNALLVQNNALLLHLASGRNDTPPMTLTLLSSTFAASCNTLAINILFSISLAFALISSFLAVLGRQRLIYYRKRSGGGPDRERWEQLKRYLGAEKWYLQFILDDTLPSLLRIGLIIFCISPILYLHTLNPTVSQVVGIPFYSDGLAGVGWNYLALVALAINLMVPDGQSPKSPDNFVELTRLQQIYSGGPGSASMTVLDIEKAANALADRQYNERLDCDVVLVNIMRKVAQLVFDRSHTLDIPIFI